MLKFLIVRFSSIGDIIQCMSIVEGIKSEYPGARIDWITRKDMAPILSMDGRIEKIWKLDKKEGFKGLIKIAKELKKERYDYVYDAHSNIRSNIIKLYLSNIFSKNPKFTLRSKERFKRILLFKFRINRFEWPFRGVQSYRTPLKSFGITNFSDKFDNWSFDQNVIDRFDNIIGSKTITLVPSANWQMKRWPIDHWKRVVELLPDNDFVILGGPQDTFCEEIRSAAPERVVNLAGETSIIESCYITKISNIILSGDTGLLHSGDMFKTPTIALIGPTAFGFPSGEKSEILQLNLPCRPCTKDGRGECKQSIYQKCMVEITPEYVVERIKKIIKS